MADDPFDLQRFLDAQGAVIVRAKAELKAGRKSSHWMWFVFPQIAGLGHSEMSRRFAIASLTEARAYLAHPTLGPGLRTCTALANAANGSANDIFGAPDDAKFHACMTLFSRAAEGQGGLFERALSRFFNGAPHQPTLDLLGT